jgi:hypothetical protein
MKKSLRHPEKMRCSGCALMNAFVALLTSMDFVSFGCIRQLEQIEDRHQSIFASFDSRDILITTISERPELERRWNIVRQKIFCM